jgi:hypothetical protein
MMGEFSPGALLLRSTAKRNEGFAGIRTKLEAGTIEDSEEHSGIKTAMLKIKITENITAEFFWFNINVFAWLIEPETRQPKAKALLIKTSLTALTNKAVLNYLITYRKCRELN